MESYKELNQELSESCQELRSQVSKLQEELELARNELLSKDSMLNAYKDHAEYLIKQIVQLNTQVLEKHDNFLLACNQSNQIRAKSVDTVIFEEIGTEHSDSDDSLMESNESQISLIWMTALC